MTATVRRVGVTATVRRVGAVAGLVAALAACSPKDLHIVSWWTGNTRNIEVRAKAGPNDGHGSHFRLRYQCNGEPFFRDGTVVSVDWAAPADGWYRSLGQCFDGRVHVDAHWDRW